MLAYGLGAQSGVKEFFHRFVVLAWRSPECVKKIDVLFLSVIVYSLLVTTAIFGCCIKLLGIPGPKANNRAQKNELAGSAASIQEELSEVVQNQWILLNQ